MAQERSAAEIPPAKAMVTTSPEVVSLSSLTLHEAAPAVGEKQRSPGAQEVTAVTVEMQVTVFPALIEHWDVDFMDVSMQTSDPVVESASAVVAAFEVVVLLSEVVEDAVAVDEVAAADADVESEVVA